MPFFADLHVHSRYSRATSRDLDLEHLALWAAKKGISVLATGDFTHPAWMAEMREKLAPAEPGLFRLRRELEEEVHRQPGAAGRRPVRFMFQVEISTIYKKGDRVRKVHHLIYAPDLEVAERLAGQLARIGNLAADGRPILGLDSRHLLEIALEAGEGCYLVPAHIWTPWFSVLGSKSGFDAVEECYDDLSPHIFAAETGLSSDPPMNWRLSALDRYTLVSNSDAHSPAKVGREACVFETAPDYFAMLQALKTGEGYGGTVEFFPEEGKYHLDGHRNCGVRLEPAETQRLGGRCPQCGKSLTVGVLHRVCELADRGEAEQPGRTAPYHSLIPLAEVLSELQGVGPTSKTVRNMYERLIADIGPELAILQEVPPEELRRPGPPLLDEAIRRMRAGQVIREAGYDGEYGVIRLFSPQELAQPHSVGLLFELPEEAPSAREAEAAYVVEGPAEASAEAALEPVPVAERMLPFPAMSTSALDGLDPDQRGAAEVVHGPLLIVAGPGTGKTRTLTHRIAHLVAEHGVSPQECLAITFTRRAAQEMRERLAQLLPDMGDQVSVMTFHALGLAILREFGHLLDLVRPLQVADEARRAVLLAETLAVSVSRARTLLKRLSDRADQADAELEGVRLAYRQAMRARGLVDFDDLIGLTVELLTTHPEVANACRVRYRWISVDEYQDVDEQQYRLVRLLALPDGNLCVIGDPDQAIYGFRGSDVRFFRRFREDYPRAHTVQLTRNYRSNRTIVDAAVQMIAPATLVERRSLQALIHDPHRIEIHECATDRAEAEFVVHTVERLIGGATFFSFDSRRVETDEGRPLSFADFAVLYRTDAQSRVLEEALSRFGIPYQKRSHRPLAGHPVVESLLEHMRALPSAEPLVARLNVAAQAVAEEAVEGEHARLVEALQSPAERYGRDLDAFCAELALGVEVDLLDPRAERVSLLTLHAAKGLEFRVVFLTGCEEGVLPLRWGSSDDAGVAEERRLFFVGMTRARDRLYLSHARRRFWRGEVTPRDPSPFLQDIQETLLERHRPQAQPKAAAMRQLTLFSGM